MRSLWLKDWKWFPSYSNLCLMVKKNRSIHRSQWDVCHEEKVQNVYECKGKTIINYGSYGVGDGEKRMKWEYTEIKQWSFMKKTLAVRLNWNCTFGFLFVLNRRQWNLSFFSFFCFICQFSFMQMYIAIICGLFVQIFSHLLNHFMYIILHLHRYYYALVPLSISILILHKNLQEFETKDLSIHFIWIMNIFHTI